MKLKSVFIKAVWVVILFTNCTVVAQVRPDTVKPKPADSGKSIKAAPKPAVKDTVKRIHADTLKRLTHPSPRIDSLRQQHKDTSFRKPVPAATENIQPPAILPDTSSTATKINIIPSRDITAEVLARNRLINVSKPALFVIQEPRQPHGKEFVFYGLCAIVLILGLFRTFYSHYFNNLFRVFFNTSLRQTQLTDQLLQAKLPSFILNIFFTITGGFYIWLLFTHFHPPRLIHSRLLLPFCIMSVALVYFIKYCLLKFMGWVSDIRQATDNYIFVIFLVNKITGIVLIPFIILLAFSLSQWTAVITTVSVLVLALFFLSRYVKSYGIIRNKVAINPFHFLIYIVGAEIIPLILVYKITIDYLI
jgi:Domain of unknown function (DUF4271)